MLGAALGGAPILRAQAPGTVQGIVFDSLTKPIAHANVSLRGLGLAVTTDLHGAFHFREVPAGRQTLVVALIGYAPQERVIDVRSGDTLEVQLQLRPATVTLQELSITAAPEADQIRQSPFAVTVIDGQRLAGRGLTLDEAL